MTTPKKNVRKFALVGAECVGKTTILEVYRQRLSQDPRYAFVEEVARQYIEKKLGQGKSSLECSQEIQDLILEKEQRAHNSGASVIFCDRSVLDSAIWVKDRTGEIYGQKMIDRMRFWLPTYQLILLDPYDVPYQPDSIRKQSIEEREKYHQTYLSTLADLQIPYLLLKGTISERISKIDQLVFGKKY
jgi:HTH-type transcriptional regulator, transcriptional repressor of NAD biosynthesis genes